MRQGRRGRRGRVYWAAGLGLGLIACLTGCLMGGWWSDATVATLVIGEVANTGATGEILLSVRDMPAGGLASIAVVIGGMTYDDERISSVTIEGLDGFTVLASEFDDATGRAGFLLAHPSGGLVDGDFARLTFDTTSSASVRTDFDFDEAQITLGDDNNETIPFELEFLFDQGDLKT